MARRRSAVLVMAMVVGARADCMSLGFTAALKCSSCEKLESIVGDAELVSDCASCCTEDVATFPSVRAFIDDMAADFEGLDVKYRNGQKPQLVMIDDDDAREVVPISGWNTDTVVEYLKENLKPSS
ncbi:hypothetical protein CTAYLR_008425 [Chrysophaeum taylorii]|uniref:Selenoprotein F n=1 Tax=Chrysophaeum taylorii TaxID=2483200 RepID=A0AAD7XPU0_9STRA|nr:hypothetical protein CTAYLR_008425 [Chrysophaeum taylorii]